jgi:PAS domain S-box-containing protein
MPAPRRTGPVDQAPGLGPASGWPSNAAENGGGLMDLTSEGLFRYELVPPMSTTLDASELAAKILESSRLAECNLVYARNHGRQNPQEMIGTSLAELLPGTPEERLGWIRSFIRAGFRLEHQETSPQAPGGRSHLFLDRMTGIVNNGFLIGCRGSQRDVTERQETEDRLTSLAVAVEQAVDDIILLDVEGRIQYVNPAFERTTGYTSAEVLGRSPKFLDSGQHDAGFYHEIETTIAAGRIWKGRFSNRTKDGRVILQDASIAPIRDASGRIVGQVSERRDVTREVEVERQAAEADKLQAIGTLAGGIAHDFNNILSAIMGNAQMAQRKAPDDPKLMHNLEVILQSARRAAALVGQILSLSRQGELDGRPVQAGLIVKEALKFLRSSVPTTIQIQGDVRSESLVHVDPAEVRHLVMNLCTNAVLAMRDQGGTLQVDLDDVDLDESFARDHPGVSPGRFLRLTVADSGCGMTPETAERAFEPFYSGWGPEPGAGMGLSVVHGIVSRGHGAITLRSEPGAGSAFAVHLPLERREEPGVAGDATELPRGSGRVFLVDDEKIVLEVTAEALDEAGYEVTAFPTPGEALAAFEADPGGVDILITDMTMPGMTGDEMARRFKAVRPGLPVILCTGFSEKISAEGVSSLGVERFLKKPVDMFQLADTIATLLAA